MNPIPLGAMEVVVDSHMAGFKFAVQFGNGPVYVSPAMYDLMKHASPEELKIFLGNLPLKRMPALPSFRELAEMPMTTQPPTHRGQVPTGHRAEALPVTERKDGG